MPHPLWRLSSVFFLYLLFCLAQSQTWAQSFTTDNYYLFPINPGEQNYLAGTMGEMRSSHFHAGIDIKTGGRSGLPVYATADGYINRIKVNTGGYGQALYMKHPNGTVSVYAHLESFAPEIEQYVIKNQYEKETFEIQLFPEKDQFYFRRGEVIAYSGNTGSSSGPHLHFEIRDANQRTLDPLKFNFPEIKDDIAPQIKSIAFVTLNEDARVNGAFGRYEFDVIKTGNTYSTRVPLKLEGKVGVELYAYDLLNGVYNRNGVSKTTLAINGDTVFSQAKTSLSFSKQRNILVHMDYEAYKKGGRKYNKLFTDDGNENDFYTAPSRGFDFHPDSTYELRIYLEDSYGNISTLNTRTNYRKIVYPPNPKIDKFEVFRNYLHFKAPYKTIPPQIKIFFSAASTELLPYRSTGRTAYYLWDLREGLPDSIDYCGEMIKTNIYAEIPSGAEISFYNHHSDLHFPKRALFDTLYLRFEKSFDYERDLELFIFPHETTPFRSNIEVTLKPLFEYPDSTARVYATYGNRLSYVGGSWDDNGKIIFRTRDLTTYTIAEDTIPPVINPRIINQKELYFKISDNLSGIRDYRATLDGKFLLMKYEYKRNLIWSVKEDENKPLKGEFILTVTDNTGNETIYKTDL